MSINALDLVDSSQPVVNPDLKLHEIISIIEPLMKLGGLLPKDSPGGLASIVKQMAILADEAIYTCQLSTAVDLVEAATLHASIWDSEFTKNIVWSCRSLLGDVSQEH
ncbi:hypothetical protein L2747_18835 [Shewanella marinintestina]|uniref:hypothetical protein n=1 Tax=Shewanella marinintestina TaxID=190305 RepID=UPI00200CE39E|nr:hypothetical protein [Shewanella marinintestina]MCL1148063.1 hypothetical protein [Shewanella marinintestina]